MKSFIDRKLISSDVESMSLNLSQTNFALQMVILAVLLVGLGFKQRGKFAVHGATMFIAVILNAFSFFWVMWPAFFGFDPFGFRQNISIVALAHGILGIVAEIFGIFLVAYWALRRSSKYCVKNRLLMRVTLTIWFVALVLGILLYAMLSGIIAT